MKFFEKPNILNIIYLRLDNGEAILIIYLMLNKILFVPRFIHSLHVFHHIPLIIQNLLFSIHIIVIDCTMFKIAGALFNMYMFCSTETTILNNNIILHEI